MRSNLRPFGKRVGKGGNGFFASAQNDSQKAVALYCHSEWSAAERRILPFLEPTTLQSPCSNLLVRGHHDLDLPLLIQPETDHPGGKGPAPLQAHTLPNLRPVLVGGGGVASAIVVAADRHEARRMGLSLPGLALAQQLYISVQAIGLGKKGTHSLQLALARLSGIDWTAR